MPFTGAASELVFVAVLEFDVRVVLFWAIQAPVAEPAAVPFESGSPRYSARWELALLPACSINRHSQHESSPCTCKLTVPSMHCCHRTQGTISTVTCLTCDGKKCPVARPCAGPFTVLSSLEPDAYPSLIHTSGAVDASGGEIDNGRRHW